MNDFLVSQDQMTAPYLVYDLRSRYIWDQGLIQLPVAYSTGQPGSSPPQPWLSTLQSRQACVTVPVRNPTGKRVVTFAIRRLGAKPVCPDPTPVNSNEIFAYAEVNESAPILQPDLQTYEYGVEGVYVYILQKPVWAGDGFRMGKTLASTDDANQNIAGTAQFRQGVL